MGVKASVVNRNTRVDVRKHSAVVALGEAIEGNHRKVIKGTQANIRRQVKRAAKVGLDDFINTIDTSGYDMPYKYNKSTLARVKTGDMRSMAKSQVVRDDEAHFSVRIGWPGQRNKYFLYQEEGTSGNGSPGSRGVRAMMARKHAAAVIRQEIKRRLG